MDLFRTRQSGPPAASSPVALFRDLRRSADVRFLWGHQEKLLDTYHANYLKTPDVALELPTGSGKTLVGLLIAEYRRRSKHERVVYLCPTRQLCKQVAAHATSYGIVCALLVGKQRDYDPRTTTAYQRAQAVAVTTYSGLFNINPLLNDANIIICDDAHAGEEFIAGLWSLQIAKDTHPLLFQGLVDLLGDAIAPEMRRRIGSEDPYDHAGVDLVPAPQYRDRLASLAELLATNTADTELAYSWRLLGGHLEACSIYTSPTTILIRPYIPPSESHPPFANASQRIYMSATLGEGGELERITGRRSITRLPIAPDWEKRGTGRRLILFPDLFVDEQAGRSAMDEVMHAPQPTLVLAQDNRSVEQVAKMYSDIRILHAQDVEDSFTPFTHAKQPIALVLANRYDGIDLPGDSCREMVFLGLPGALNLQEMFLQQRLGATAPLRDRLRTRLTQGLGRCTRDENDYALVLLIGRDILKWCASTQNVQGLNPEVQAEIAFGLDNSPNRTAEEFSNLRAAFLEQNEAWGRANEEIIALREERNVIADTMARALKAASAHELAYVYALWRHDFEHAYDRACSAVEALAGGDDLKPFRALWLYNAAVAADYAWERTHNTQWRENYRSHLGKAIGLTSNVPWLAGLRDLHSSSPEHKANDVIGVEEIGNLLTEWEVVGHRFAKGLRDARGDINSDEAKPFERGLALLGRMVGCRTRHWTGNGEPDVLWVFVDGSAVVFEAKSEENPLHAVSLAAVRQVGSHPTFVRSKTVVVEGAAIYAVLATHQERLHSDAKVHAANIYYIDVATIRSLFNRAATTLETVRSRAVGLTEEAQRELIATQYKAASLTQADVLGTVRSQALQALLTL